MPMKNLILPADKQSLKSIDIGEIVSLSGTIFTARDQAHRRITALLAQNSPLPVDMTNIAIYYCGPTPARENEIIGSCGPTTSARMDKLTAPLLDAGMTVCIGKGKRSDAVKDAITKCGAAYFSAVGGAGALIKNCITSCSLVAFPDLGCEAIYKLTVKNLEAVRLI